MEITEQYLIDFEDEVVRRFKNKEILSPTHLYSNNEAEMIKIFKDIPRDGVGLAIASKIKRDGRKTFVFLGDMTSETGAFHECITYSMNHDLPIKFIIEDNGFSVCTDTKETWGIDELSYEGIDDEYVYYYKYKSKYPHAGVGERINF